MDILGHLLRGGALQAGTPGPTDDFWYQATGTMSAAGVRIDPETAKKISAWYRGRDILATVLAMLPLQVMERLPNDGGSRPATDEPLYDVLHNEPNGWQDSYLWRRQKMYHLIDHGNSYDRILPGARGFVDELHPIDPTLVTPQQLDNGRIVYRVRNPKTNITFTLSQDEVFHLCGASDDGITGKGILEYARTSLGTASATETYAANIFSKGTLNGGTIENPGVLNDEAARRMARSFATRVGEWHLPKILEQGSKFVPNKMTPEDAQMLESRKYTVDDLARWLGVPRLMLENSDPSFGNAEQFTQNFLDINMGGWFALWEFGINRQLILDRQRFFARINRKAIGRSNFKELVDGHVALVNAGIESVDEARSIEDMPKRGGKADALREPQNITGKPTAEPPSDAMDGPPADMPSKAYAIAQASAERLLRKEVAAVQKAAVRHAADGGFEAAVAAFYTDHVGLVQATLQLSETEAAAYCARQAEQITRPEGDWLAALALWQTAAYAGGLAAIALEEAA